MPLIGLEDIEWDKLTHNYGSAKNIPDLLRALDAAETEEEFYELSYELWGYINHQADHYDSTPVCVPFLFQILRNKQLIEQKLDVLISLGELLRTLRKDANNYPIVDESKTYSLISNELEYLLSLLLGEKLELRVGSLYVLSFLHQQAEQILPALFECVQSTNEAQLKASAIRIYAQFAKLTPIPDREKCLLHLMEWTKSPTFLVQYAAAFGYMSIRVPVVPVAEHIISLVAQRQTTKDWSMKESSSKGLHYLYSELMLDLLGK